MSKKSLDKLFQEKFLNFKETPDEMVWNSIETSLNKRKKKRIIPIWWQLGGIAALLAIGLLFFNPYDGVTIPEDDGITNIEQKDNESPANDLDKVQKIPNNSEITSEKVKPDDTNADSQIAKSLKNKDVVTPKKEKANSFIQESNDTKDYKATNANIASQEQSFDDSDDQSETIHNVIKENSKNSGLALEESTNKNIDNTNSLINSTTENLKGKEKEVTKSNEKINLKKSLFDELNRQEEEETAIVEKSGKRWSAGPSIAPVYYDAMGKGSPVSPMFSSNSKSGNINLSYGVAIAYEISPKFSVRSGVHKVDYGYNTNDVYFTSSISAISQGQISNINYAETSENLVVSSNNATLNSSSKSFDVSAKNVNKSGVMAQQLGYLEVPVELSYALVNNKFGLNVIGGVSSLFLVDNAVDLTSGSLTTQIGEANNVNDLNFSANFGIGLGYQFSQNLRLNIEPVFKYQLNTFSNVDGTFNPYSVGVYSGLSFKF